MGCRKAGSVSDSLRGKRRKRDRTNDVVGAYVVVGPVGINWKTSRYWILRDPVCGHEIKSTTESMHGVAKRACCGGCGRKVEA